MQKKTISSFFEAFLNSDSVFKNKPVLFSTHTPCTILHRDEQVQALAGMLAPALKTDKPSNIFIYGKTGTGKTLSVKHVTTKMLEIAAERAIPLKIIYVNCKLKKIADTEYRLIAHMTRELGRQIPPTGLPTDEVYRLFMGAVDREPQTLIFILDEIDQLVNKVGDEILYNLTRINEDLKNTKISIVGISNDMRFADGLDPRVKSSLSEEEVLFPPYNAIQIKNILIARSEAAFKKNALLSGVIEKISAIAAREHGDARRAIELLRVAGEIADRETDNAVRLTHVDLAMDAIEQDRAKDIVAAQPKQYQLVLYSIFHAEQERKKTVLTGEVYHQYRVFADRTGLRPLTQRRVSDVLAELDMLGIITARVKSKGRYGRTREIMLAIPPQSSQRIKKMLEEGLGL